MVQKKFVKILHLVAISLLLFSCGPGAGLIESASNNSSENSNAYQPPSGPVADFKLTCEEARFIRFINIYRAASGISALSVSRNAVIAARWHSQNMIDLNYFSHTEPNGRDFSARTNAFGYAATGENIAAGNRSALELFCQWRNSSGHNANMLKSTYSTTGIGEASGGGTYGIYWSSNFGRNTSDTLSEPLTLVANCAMPSIVPGCN